MSETSARAATYTRISKDKTGDEHGVANQQAELNRHAAARGWVIVARESDNDLSASNGVHRPGYEAVMRLVDAGQVDVVLVWAVDRFVRRIADLESVIGRFTKTGARLAAVTGDLDLGNDAGRMVARMLSVIAQGEVERKSARQKLAAAGAASAGKRWTGCPRPFGWQADHVTLNHAEAEAIRWAAGALLGGSTISAVAREWDSRGLRPVQAPFGPLPSRPWSRTSVTTVLRNPRLAGLSAYRGQIVYGDSGEPVTGQWQPVLPRGTWEAVNSLLTASQRIITDSRGRTRRVRPQSQQGVRTLLGGLAACRCGNTVQGSRNQLSQPIYRCNPATRGDRPGPHATIRAAPVTGYVEDIIVGVLAERATGLVTPKRPDLTPLRAEAAAIRRKLDADAVDELRGVLTSGQLRARTEWGTQRLAEIEATLAGAASESVLAPFAATRNARAVWDGLDLPRQRRVLAALATVTLHPAGQGARVFSPDTVHVEPVTP
jgi:site-specific DNA recombinase